MFEGVPSFLQPTTIFDSTEQDAAFSFGVAFAVRPATLWSPPGWQIDRLCTGRSDKRYQLSVPIADGVSTFLLGHDVIEPLLWSGQEWLDSDRLAGLGRALSSSG